MGLDLFGGNFKASKFFEAIKQLGIDADKSGVKIKSLIIFYDDDGIAAELTMRGEIDKMYDLRKIIREE
jgi:hypothetical protein